MAKQLNAKGFICWPSIAWPFTQGFHSQQVFGFPLLASVVFGILAIFRIRQTERDLAERLLIIAISVWVPCFFLIQLSITQYPIYSWYFYPAGLAFPLLMVLGYPKIAKNAMPWIPVAVIASILMIRDVVTTRPSDADKTTRFEIALQLSQWAQLHPGRFAMGDRAGMVGYMLPMPLIQLEGLVADSDMIEFIERQASIQDVFTHYRVDYYIRTRKKATPPGVNGCYDAHEPINVNGDRTLLLTGQICDKPVYQFLTTDGQETSVFAVSHIANRS
jgi:hypothetical protein